MSTSVITERIAEIRSWLRFRDSYQQTRFREVGTLLQAQQLKLALMWAGTPNPSFGWRSALACA